MVQKVREVVAFMGSKKPSGFRLVVFPVLEPETMGMSVPEIEVWCVRCGDPTYFNDGGWMIPTDRWYCDECFRGWLREDQGSAWREDQGLAWDVTDQ